MKPDLSPILTLDFDAKTTRRCGDCQLCCKLLPTKELDKPGNTRCQHQKVRLGCKIYARRPPACQLWSCRWLTRNDTEDMHRPDRVHYVLDPIPDYVTAQNNQTGAEQVVPVIQIWCDPAYRDAHRDPGLRRYLARRAAEGWCGLARYGQADAVLIVPPELAHNGQWIEHSTMNTVAEHNLLDTIASITEGRDLARDPN